MTDSQIKYPKGYPVPPDNIKLAISFPRTLFFDIMAMAKKERKTFNATVADLCTCGKLCLDESDALEEPKP